MFYETLGLGGWSPFKTYIIVLGTPQGVSLFTASLQFNEPLQLHLSTNIIPQTCESSWTPSLLIWCNMSTYYADNAVCLYIQPKG